MNDLSGSPFFPTETAHVDNVELEITSHWRQTRFNNGQLNLPNPEVITAQGAKCRNVGVVELQVRIREFVKPWQFHILADFGYPCILGVDFISGSKIVLDFDRKSLAIQDSQVEEKKVDDGNLSIDFSETKLNVVANVSDKNPVEGIQHVKTVVYRPQSNRTERVNRDLVQMIASYVNDNHDTWDQFLREFTYAIRTAVKETTGKIPAELFLGRTLITPFQKLVMVSDGTEFAVGDIEKLFDEARRNTKAKQEKWAKYYYKRRRDVRIKVNDWVLLQTHPLSSAAKKVVAKFKPKFEGPYRLVDVHSKT
ncbi:retrovirus-related Pol polyprotein from transposon 297 [Trichonephila clavipes]|nr:retrovirus-related Pol polyprotein from transposon 297 [Trichonephila clavipes]